MKIWIVHIAIYDPYPNSSPIAAHAQAFVLKIDAENYMLKLQNSEFSQYKLSVRITEQDMDIQ